MNTQDAQRRINEAYELLKWRHIIEKQEDLASIMGTSRPNVSAALAGKPAFLTINFIKRFYRSFPNIFNLEWLLKGEGEMLQESKNDIEPQPIDHSSLVNALIAAKDETIATLRQQLTILQQQLEDKDAIIRLLRSHYDTRNGSLPAAAEP
jgi:transcriptional regulator with XRE-family HTH domain